MMVEPARLGGCSAICALVLVVLCGVTAPGAQADDDASVSALSQGKLDLNRASLAEVSALPMPEQVARNIVEYRDYVRYFDDIYDLLEVPGVTAEILDSIKSLVATLPPPEGSADMARITAGYRQVRRYLNQEGFNEGLVDEYLDLIRTPDNINDLDVFDLQSIQNVSPVDASNILAARERLGSFDNSRQLRRTEGLRYWSYRNLRDFVVYTDAEKSAIDTKRLSGYYQFRYYNTPYYTLDDEVSVSTVTQVRTGFLVQDTLLPEPAMTHKLRLHFTRQWGGGLLTHRDLGDSKWNETTKWYVTTADHQWGPLNLKRLVLGNFRASFGLGLIMDNTDFVRFRRTGFGWSKRLLGIHNDLSRTRQYAMTGLALEGSISRFHFAFWGSSDHRDVVLNSDGTANRLITLHPRLDQEWLDDRDIDGYDPSLIVRDGLKEEVIGANLKYMLGRASWLGLSGFESRYDRAFRSDVSALVADMDRLEARDSEIAAGYTSVVEDQEAGVRESYKFRRILGAEFQTVFNNVSLQGEYAFMQNPRYSLFDSRNPDAYVFNAFAQWDNLHVLGIYRDRDLFYDNPFDRSFGEDNRYEQTILDSPFRLNDPLYTFIEIYTPQPKPEKGLFFDTRYRISRNLIMTGFQFDQWKRKADGADLMRYTLRGEYQPIFNLRLRVRHRYSSRTEAAPEDVRTFRNWETRFRLIGLLSNYNRVSLMYMTSNVMFPARQRLSYPTEADIGRSGVGLAADPGQALEARLEFNLTPGITFYMASSVYNGFMWNFEGNEFVLLDGNGFRNWLLIESRVSERLMMQLKVTSDHHKPRTFVDIRDYGNESYGDEPDADYAPRDNLYIRLQIDYTF